MSRKFRINSTHVKTYQQPACSDPSMEFTVDHIHDLRSAVVCLLDAVAAVVDMKSGDIPESYYSITQQVQALDENLFKKVHNRYLWWSDSFPDISISSKNSLSGRHSSKPSIRTFSQLGFAITYSRVEADRFLKSLFVAFEACKTALLQSFKRRSLKEANLLHQISALKSKMQTFEKDVSLANAKVDDAKRKREAWISHTDQLEQELQASKEKILQLEKITSVIHWQKDLDKCNMLHTQEMSELQALLETERNKHSQAQANLTNRIKRLEHEIGKLKLKSTIPPTYSSVGLMEKLDHLNQQLFLRNQEIHSIKKFLSQQRAQMAGCIHGLQEDYKHLLRKLQQENPSKEFSPDADFVKYQATLRFVYDSCVKGSLRDISVNLPTHYSAVDEAIICLNKSQKKTNSYLLPSLPSKDHRAHADVKLLSPCSIPRSNSLIVSKKLQSTESGSRPRSATNDSPASLSVLQSSQKDQEHRGLPKTTPHPQIVDPVTGRANQLQVMKHFPYLTVEQVSHQWENFRKFDKNRDFCLDLPELYDVITSVCKLKVTVSDMKEAIKEVDRDQSNSIDFYEYLKIMEMIVRKQGTASLFKSEKLQDGNLISSHGCDIQ